MTGSRGKEPPLSAKPPVRKEVGLIRASFALSITGSRGHVWRRSKSLDINALLQIGLAG
jgi:hypothetical protein